MCARTFFYSAARFGVRRGAGFFNISRYIAIRAKNSHASGSRFSALSLALNGCLNRFCAIQVARHGTSSLFAAVKPTFVVVAAARFDTRTEHCNGSGLRFSARSAAMLALSDRFGARFPTARMSVDRFTLRSIVAALSKAKCNAYSPHGWTIFARNAVTGEAIRLGFISADAVSKVIADVPLADGVWEIEARPSQWFWNECRGRKIVTLVTGETAIGDEPLQGLPAIQNLRRDLVSFQSVIKWNVVAEYEPDDFRFGLWFGPASPVDTSGAPDIVVPHFSGQGEYKAVRAQTKAEYAAVATFNDDCIGPMTEIELPWSTSAPAVPPNQTASNGG